METSVSKKPASASTGTMEFLSFSLGGLEYGLEFNKVQELRMLQSLERVASGGEMLNGVAVSRGVIMPIVDMRAAVEGVPAPPDPGTDVIILELNNCVMGMVVDGVTGVVQLRQDQISPVPGASNNADYLLGLGESEGRRLVLVDIDKLMAIKRRSAGPRQHTA
ncbi:MAG TPA: chemotaxis protein CheW [Telluria sp.]